MEDRRVVRHDPVDVRVDQQLVIDAVDRVVQHRAMQPDLHAGSARRGLNKTSELRTLAVSASPPMPSASPALGHVGAVRITEQDANPDPGPGPVGEQPAHARCPQR